MPLRLLKFVAIRLALHHMMTIAIRAGSAATGSGTTTFAMVATQLGTWGISALASCIQK